MCEVVDLVVFVVLLLVDWSEYDVLLCGLYWFVIDVFNMLWYDVLMLCFVV